MLVVAAQNAKMASVARSLRVHTNPFGRCTTRAHVSSISLSRKLAYLSYSADFLRRRLRRTGFVKWCLVVIVRGHLGIARAGEVVLRRRRSSGSHGQVLLPVPSTHADK